MLLTTKCASGEGGTKTKKVKQINEKKRKAMKKKKSCLINEIKCSLRRIWIGEKRESRAITASVEQDLNQKKKQNKRTKKERQKIGEVSTLRNSNSLEDSVLVLFH